MIRNHRFLNALLLLGVAFVQSLAVMAMPQASADEENLLLVYFNGYRLDVFPESLIDNTRHGNGQLRVTVVSDTAFCYDEDRIDSVVIRTRSQLADRLPAFKQFKFNNKYNDQVYTDVVADIEGDSLITAQVGAIGKWLTPSFQLTDDSTRVYLDGRRQYSKQSRLKFDTDKRYTLSLYGWRQYSRVVVKEAVVGDPGEEFLTTPVALSADQFSSNLPGQDGEGFAQMIDGDPSTIFHSTWNVSQDQKQEIYNTDPYIDIALTEPLRRLVFSYTTRNSGTYWPQVFTLLASNDGQEWTTIRQFTQEADGLPQQTGTTWTSPTVDLGASYSYLRLYLNKAAYRRYLVLAEFALWRVDENPDYGGPEIIEPAEYRYEMRPFGREYRVHVDFLTEQPQSQVPRIDIYTNTGEMISSRDYYLDATISIDGGGVYPSMETTPVQIKGRGNSSWSSWYWDKNPYRLKFASKQKPLGLTNGKSWVLLANKQGGSMMSNAIGMKAACLVQTAGANHMVPVELYINGDYRGSYNFTEKVGISNNSIDLDDESRATLLELDTYYDETYRFRSNPYSLPVNIKFPDFSEDPTQLSQSDIEQDFNRFVNMLKAGREISSIVDIDALARYLFVNELIVNYELHHPKSTFLYNAAVGTDESRFVFGPVWDLDWAYGYEHNRGYCTTDGTAYYWTAVSMESRQFLNDLRFVSSDLDRAYYLVCIDFLDHHLDELLDYCDDYYAYAHTSFEHNAEKWGDGTTYQQATANAKTWLRQRINSILARQTSYDRPETPADPDEMTFTDDHADGIETLSAEASGEGLVDVFDLNGRLVKRQVSVLDLRTGLRPGIYIVKGKKLIIR